MLLFNLTLTQKQVEVDALAETNRLLSARIKEMTTVITKQEEIVIKERNDKVTQSNKILTTLDFIFLIKKIIISYKTPVWKTYV